MSEVIH